MELFVLMPTEICATPYYVLPDGIDYQHSSCAVVTNITLSFSYLSTEFLHDSLIRCVFGVNTTSPTKWEKQICLTGRLLSAHELVCLTPDLRRLQGAVLVRLE